MRTRITVLSSVLLGVAGVVAAAALAKPMTAPMGVTAKLNIAQEVPKETGAPRTAGGAFTATLSGSTLKWKLSFGHLTGAATAAHIHMGAKGKAGPVIVPLCGPCKSGVNGTVKVSAAVIKAIEGGGAYVNVHTAKNPNGEIRGQVSG
jgi:CHRD domain-containing protein